MWAWIVGSLRVRVNEDHSSSAINLRCSVHGWLTGGDSEQPSSAFMMEKELQVLQAGCWLHPRGSEVGGPAVLPWAVTSGWSCCQKPSLKGQGQWLKSTGQVQPLQRGANKTQTGCWSLRLPTPRVGLQAPKEEMAPQTRPSGQAIINKQWHRQNIGSRFPAGFAWPWLALSPEGFPR